MIHIEKRLKSIQTTTENSEAESMTVTDNILKIE